MHMHKRNYFFFVLKTVKILRQGLFLEHGLECSECDICDL